MGLLGWEWGLLSNGILMLSEHLGKKECRMFFCRLGIYVLGLGGGEETDDKLAR